MFDGIDVNGDGRRSAGEIVWFVVRMFALGFSAMTTGAFFYSYVGGAFSFFFGQYSPLFTAFAGVMSLDVFSQLWAYLRANHADTADQINYSRALSWLDLTSSIIVTVVYLMLASAFDLGITNADGTLTNWGTTLNLIGISIIVLAIAGNFLGVHMYLSASSQMRSAVQGAVMRAMRQDGQFQVDRAREHMTVQKTMTNINRALPQLTDQAAGTEADEYLTRYSLPGNIPTSGDGPSFSMLEADTIVRNDRGEPVKRYDILFTEDGNIHTLGERLTLGAAWHRVDTFHNSHSEHLPDGLFVIDAETRQPVDRSGRKIDVEMVLYDEDDLGVADPTGVLDELNRANGRYPTRGTM